MSALLSAFHTSLRRYGRSAGLWILLLVAPVGARFMIAPRGQAGSVVSVDGRAPWLTSQVLGMEMGVVIATLLLPAAFIYLRANVVKRQPWQVEEVTAAARPGILFGRWLADTAVMAGVLAATSAAGLALALFLLPLNEVRPLDILLPLWAIAAPPMAMVASLRIAFDARRMTRGWVGEALFFVLWMASLTAAIIPMAANGKVTAGFGTNMTDLAGFVSPLSYSRGGASNFAIGGGDITPGPPIPIDVMSGLFAPGYLAARAAWLAIAAAIPLLAGLAYAPHVTGKTRTPSRLSRWLSPGPAPKADPAAPPARGALLPFLGLVLAETRLMAPSRLMRLAMLAAALAGLAAPWRTVAGPAALLLLVFAATGHAGRSEAKGLIALTATALNPPWARRIAFVIAGTGLMLAMSAPAMLRAPHIAPTILLEAAAAGAAASATAIGLGALTRSATAPRLLLLIAWYGWLNAAS